MGWTMYQADFYKKGRIDRKAEVLELCKKCKSNLLKLVSKGSKYYALFETKSKEMWCCLFLTRTTNNNEFWYKDIELNPNEIGGIPDSILKSFVPSNDNDKEWLLKNIQANKKENDKKKAEPKIELGDVLECQANHYIWWNGGYELQENDKFLVTVEKLNPFRQKSKTIFVITEYQKKLFSEEYEYVRRLRRLDRKHFTILRKVA